MDASWQLVRSDGTILGLAADVISAAPPSSAGAALTLCIHFGSRPESAAAAPGRRALRSSLRNGGILGYAHFCDGIHWATPGHTGTTGFMGENRAGVTSVPGG